MKIEIELSEENEGTSAPWWVIIDPKQNLSKSREATHNIASMITGPFFSRQEAEDHLTARSHAFGCNAVVFCMSGYWSREYGEAIKKAKEQK
jgi:hypothetical protein